MLMAQRLPHVQFVLPTAKEQPVTLNGGAMTPAWYDLASLNSDPEDPAEGLDDARETLMALVANSAIPPHRTVIGGFSQGGAVALYSAMQAETTFAGVLGLSAYLPRPSCFVCSEANKATPVLMCHGDRDMVVGIGWGAESAKKLREAEASTVDFRIYEGMEHDATEGEIGDVCDWLEKVLPDVDVEKAPLT